MFLIHCYAKHGEIDDYEQGCRGDSGFYFEDRYTKTADSLAEALAQIEKDFGFGSEDRTEIGEITPGRLDYCRHEDAHGHIACADDIERWKLGRLELWLTTYTFTIYEAEPVRE